MEYGLFLRVYIYMTRLVWFFLLILYETLHILSNGNYVYENALFFGGL